MLQWVDMPNSMSFWLFMEIVCTLPYFFDYSVYNIKVKSEPLSYLLAFEAAYELSHFFKYSEAYKFLIN